MAVGVGERLGQYRLVEFIGRGSIADVYRGEEERRGTCAAIKVIYPHLLRNAVAYARFRREVEVLAVMRHPNIVRILEFGWQGTPFIAMELLEGGTLGEHMDRARAEQKGIPLGTVIAWITALCSAVEYAHGRRLVHRDLKPANVLFRESGKPVLTDFGVAALLDRPRQSLNGTIAGTPAYLSPEQARGEAGDARSDVYSLGAMLLELLVGEVPSGGTELSRMLKHLSETPAPLHVFNPRVPRPVEQIVMRAVEKDPARRFQSARARGDALCLAADNASLVSVSASSAAAESEPPRREPMTIRQLWEPGPKGAVSQAEGFDLEPVPRRQGVAQAGMLVAALVLIGVVTWSGIRMASATAGRDEPASSSPALAIGSQVRLAPVSTESVSVLRDCPGAFWLGVTGIASDGEAGTVLGRKVCDGQWWYRVSFPGLQDLDWGGEGWVDGSALRPR